MDSLARFFGAVMKKKRLITFGQSSIVAIFIATVSAYPVVDTGRREQDAGPKCCRRDEVKPEPGPNTGNQAHPQVLLGGNK